MRSQRAFFYAVGWAVLTVLAAFAVWWGLRPLLSSSFAAVPMPASPSPTVIFVPASPASPSPARPSSAAPKPKPSMYDGWAYSNGAFTRSFDVTGGTATVRISGGVVSLVSSAARDGYTITQEQPQPQRLVLKFLKPGGRYTIVDCHWWEGRPYAEVSFLEP
ncbi:hypothetical protein [Rhizocola hellebori]|nr:hypothetical protein [Rhizocola hellebori]